MPRKPSSQPAAAERRALDDDPVVQGILKAISLKRIRSGTKLGEDRLAQAFGTSRLHVRQVLAHLAARNVVTQYPNRGAFVWQPTVHDAHEMLHARLVLERATVAALVDGLNDVAAAALREHVAREAMHNRGDRWESLALTGEFHVLIARLSGNRVMTDFVRDVMVRTSLIISTFELPGSADCSPDAHPGIAELILVRDRDGAVSAMDKHLHEIHARLHLDETQKDPDDIVAIFQDLGLGPRARGAA